MNITAIIETTENCNLNCSFCLRPSFEHNIMNKDILNKIIKQVIDNSDKRADFIWHGGEPLLAGLRFFKLIPELQKKYNKKRLIIKNTVQTNGTLINKDFADFFDKNNFRIGTSIQATKKIHDISRRDKGNRPTYDRIISNIKNLKEKPSSIMVLTKDILGKEKEIYKSLKKQVNGIRISEYFPSKTSEKLMPTPKQYGKSMLKFYSIWKKDSNPIEIRPISEIIRSFILGRSSGCLYSQKACNNSIVGVKPNGNFFTCLRATENARFFLGNVNSNPLKKYNVLGNKLRKERINVLLKKNCKDCKFWNYCNGGCPQESMKLYDNINHKTIYCEGRKILFKAIAKDLGRK